MACYKSSWAQYSGEGVNESDSAPWLVLGAGAWGSALALKLAETGVSVRLWARDAQAVLDLKETAENARYLPGIQFPPSISAFSDLRAAAEGVRNVLIATPTGAFDGILSALLEHIENPRIAWACKGFERGQGRLLHKVVSKRLGREVPCAVVSGPTFAAEVAAGLPSAVVVAGDDAEFVQSLSHALHGPKFRVYASDDLVGVQIGGAMKNVLAIAAGISDGLKLGANARAALISRGLAEMVRLSTALGGRAETAMGLAGLGDLVLTCTDDQSRNRRFGLALGEGCSVEDAQQRAGTVVEGAHACKDIMMLAKAWQVELPIAEQVNAVVWGGATPDTAVKQLLARSPGREG